MMCIHPKNNKIQRQQID